MSADAAAFFTRCLCPAFRNAQHAVSGGKGHAADMFVRPEREKREKVAPERGMRGFAEALQRVEVGVSMLSGPSF